MKNIKNIILTGISLIVLACAVFLLQVWFEIFSADIFAKLTTTFFILLGGLFVGGLLYYEYSSNQSNRDDKLLN